MDAHPNLLLELQGVSLELRRQREQRAAYARRLTEIARTRQALLRELSQGETELNRLATAIRNGERELTALEEKLAHLRDRSAVVRTPKEAQALEHEMDLLGQKKADAETQLLNQMEEQEKLEKKIADYRKETQAKIVALDAESQRLAQLSREADELISTLQSDEQRLLSMLSEEVRAIYTRLLEKQVIPMVAFVREASCSGCLTTLPSALVTDLLTKGGVEFCPSCKRLIYHSATPPPKGD